LAATEPPFELCRRATGGGIVDHRDDWTYALVIPRGHPLEERPATQSYREIHEALAAALRAQGADAVTKPCADEQAACAADSPVQPGKRGATAAAGPAGVCFQRAEIYDVVSGLDGAKIAGAAQKRNKHGLLFQGSVWRPAAMVAAGGAALDWDRFGDDFTAQLATALDVEARPSPWPELDDDEVSALTEQYASPEWREHR
jgi:lipoate-protein ligase A